MAMYDDFLKIIKYLKSDEELNRLLYYPPEDLGKDVLDPLDSNLPNIMTMNVEKRAEIINKRIMKSSKFKDLEKESICRLYVYAGNGSSSSGNYLFANQELVIDILCHSDFENGDLRSFRISDRLNELFCHQNLVGIGQMDFVNRRPIGAPVEYVGYQVVFKYSTFKK
jgi:hypothetical protein